MGNSKSPVLVAEVVHRRRGQSRWVVRPLGVQSFRWLVLSGGPDDVGELVAMQTEPEAEKETRTYLRGCLDSVQAEALTAKLLRVQVSDAEWSGGLQLSWGDGEGVLPLVLCTERGVPKRFASTRSADAAASEAFSSLVGSRAKWDDVQLLTDSES